MVKNKSSVVYSTAPASDVVIDGPDVSLMGAVPDVAVPALGLMVVLKLEVPPKPLKPRLVRTSLIPTVLAGCAIGLLP